VSLSYLKLAVLAARVIVALHVFEDRDLALTLCFSTFGTMLLERLFRGDRFPVFQPWIEIASDRL
jgi:hypothetical protein